MLKNTRNMNNYFDSILNLEQFIYAFMFFFSNTVFVFLLFIRILCFYYVITIWILWQMKKKIVKPVRRNNKYFSLGRLRDNNYPKCMFTTTRGFRSGNPVDRLLTHTLSLIILYTGIKNSTRWHWCFCKFVCVCVNNNIYDTVRRLSRPPRAEPPVSADPHSLYYSSRHNKRTIGLPFSDNYAYNNYHYPQQSTTYTSY